MKKFLFLLLGLAVSASAYAGVNSQRITKDKAVPASRHAVAPLNENYASIKKGYTQKAHSDFAANAFERTASRTVVTEQPEGEVKYFKRSSGTGVWLDGDYYTPGTPQGYVTAVVNGNDIWFKNLLYDPDSYIGDYWVKGTKQGNYLTLEQGQGLASFGQYGEVQLTWGTVAISGNSLTFSANTNQVIRFRTTNNGKTWTLQNSSTVDDGYGFSGTGLGCYLPGYSATYFFGFMSYNTVLEEANDLPETPTMYNDDYVEALEGDEVAYYRKGYALVYDSQGDSIALTAQNGYAWIFYANDGSVYMRDPVYGAQTHYWVKGTKNGNKITMPLGQYVYWTTDFVGFKTAWGEMVTEGEEEVDTFDYTGEVTYTIDDQTITLDNSEYSENAIKGLALVVDSAYVDFAPDNWSGYLDFYTTYYVFPDAPAGVTVNPAATTADVSWEPSTLTQWNLRYRERVEGADFYSTGFETDADLENWWTIDYDGDGHRWGLRELSQGGMSGQCLTSASWDPNTQKPLTPDNWMVSPAVDLNGVVRFKAWGQDPAYPSEVIHVYVTTNTNWSDSESFPVEDFESLSDDITVVALDTINAGYANNVYQFDLSAYAGQQGCIAIRHYNVTDMFYVNIDDVFVGDPDVIVPEWNYVNGVTEIPYTITGLTPETNYEVQLQGVNGGGTGDWSASTLFTTLAEGGYLRGDVDGSGTVDITDATTLINYLLYGNANPFVEDNADVDYSGDIDITDATTLINFLLYGNWPD